MQTSAQLEVWSLIETLEAAPRRLDFDQTELRTISPRTTACYQVTLQRVDACIDILKNLHTELWRMNNLPLELIHQCTTGDDGQQCNTDTGTLYPQLNRRVSILTQRRKKSRAPQLTLAVQKKNGCVFVPHVRANELVSFSSLPVVSVCHHGSSISFADRYLSFLIHGHRATGGRTGLACISVR